VIPIPNERTLELGAERSHSHFTDELGIQDFQVNTPFPGGASNAVKPGYPLETGRLSEFLVALARVWLERGFERGVRVGPFDGLVRYFVHGGKDFLCIWRDNCANEFVCIDPRGHVAQCDCWATSYPESRSGNVFDSGSLSDLLRNSPARLRIQSRPGVLIRTEDCLDCNSLSIRHGGCPVRAYSGYGDLFRKDPYCALHGRIFPAVEELAARYVS